jgi:hypothetical protein
LSLLRNLPVAMLSARHLSHPGREAGAKDRDHIALRFLIQVGYGKPGQSIAEVARIAPTAKK